MFLTNRRFCSVDPSQPNYARIAVEGPAAKGGAGGTWPSYIGAFPPGPAPKEGDWFTRLRKRWPLSVESERKLWSPRTYDRLGAKSTKT